MDAATPAASSTWTQSSPRSAEAGYQDPQLGWIGVRAEGTASGVHASLVANSSEAATALGGQMEGLSRYLSDRHSGVSTLSLNTPEDRSSGGFPSATSGQGSSSQQEFSQGQGGFGRQEQSSASSPQSTSSEQAFAPVSAGGATATDADSLPDSDAFRGGHISVLA